MRQNWKRKNGRLVSAYLLPNTTPCEGEHRFGDLTFVSSNIPAKVCSKCSYILYKEEVPEYYQKKRELLKRIKKEHLDLFQF